MTSEQATVLLLDLALVLIMAHAFGAAAARLGQPAVIGEMLAGITVGPTLFHGAISRTLFPADTRPFLGAMANVGVALFMFTVGLELDRKLILSYGRVAGVVTTGSVLLPFGLGSAVAVLLLDHDSPPKRLGFVLFMGVAMSVTAFPVLARILAEKGLHRTTFGGLAMACAAAGDVLAWLLLAAVVAVNGSGGRHYLLLLGLVPYLLLMLLVVRPLLARLLADPPEATAGTRPERLPIVLCGLLVSAGVTEWLGLHFIFGAFLFGAVMPRARVDRIRQDMAAGPGRLVSVLMLPVFFVVAGMNVDLSAVGSTGLVDLALILLVAIAGKTLGTFVTARMCRLRPRHSMALAILMNTRGLTELVILSVGLQLGVLPPRLYSIMVVMAVVTTAMAGPLLALVHPQRSLDDRFDLGRVPGRAPQGG